jgi:hypothetical protein
VLHLIGGSNAVGHGSSSSRTNNSVHELIAGKKAANAACGYSKKKKKTLLAYSNSFRALTNNYRDASSTERERGHGTKLLP